MNYTTSLKSSGMRKAIPQIGDCIQPVFFALNNYSLSRYWYSSLNQVALTATETPWKRLELGFGYENFNLGDLPQDILRQTGANITDQTVSMYNANARLQLLKEDEFEQKWIPALTAGANARHTSRASIALLSTLRASEPRVAATALNAAARSL